MGSSGRAQGSAAVSALADNTQGSADNVLQAIPNPADTPVTPDALRDDIVNNVLPALRNNYADLAAKFNALRSALISAGVLK